MFEYWIKIFNPKKFFPQPWKIAYICTAKTKYKNFETNIPRKGISSPNFHIHASVSDLYISTIGLPILLEEVCRPILGLYTSLTDTWMWKLGLRPRYSQKRNTIVGFSLQCVWQTNCTHCKSASHKKGKRKSGRLISNYNIRT